MTRIEKEMAEWRALKVEQRLREAILDWASKESSEADGKVFEKEYAMQAGLGIDPEKYEKVEREVEERLRSEGSPSGSEVKE